MNAEATRCVDCGAPIRSIPSWLSGAKVTFTCASCPKKSARAPRIDTASDSPVALLADPDLGDEPLEDAEEPEIDLPADEIEEPVE